MGVPVTVLAGPLGAGKTTTLNHLLTADHGHEVAVLVNDVGAVNVDADLVERRVSGDREVVELSNGCICCGMGDAFESTVVDLALEESFDYLLVEPSGVSEPAPVVRPFVSGHAAGFYEVDSVTAVVDAGVVAEAFGSDGRDPGAVTPPDDGEPRPLSDLVVEAVEFCDAVVVNKTDRVSGDELSDVLVTVHALQPAATVFTATFGEVPPDRLLDTGRFELEAVADSAGWKRALDRADGEAHDHGEPADHGDHPHDGVEDHSDHAHRHPPEEYGVESLVYERRVPFHPERLAALFADPPGRLLRAKGWVHVAGRPDHALTLSLAGRESRVDVAGRWIASMDGRLQSRYREARDPDWDETYGDRKTELVILGRGLAELGIEAALDDCLCTAAELADDGLTPAVEPAENPFPSREGRRVRL